MAIQLPQPLGAQFGAPPKVIRDLPRIVRSVQDGEAPPWSRVGIGPFEVCDLAQRDVVDAIVAGAVTAASSRSWITYALHVGGLNERRDTQFVAAMSHADLVYADGMSVVMLARIAGAKRIERSGTTDIGWSVLTELTQRLGRPARVALVGGPDGLTARAGAVLESEAGVEIVLTEHGFHDDWSPVLHRLVLSRCDVLILGLGAPAEMKWVEHNRDRLPPCLVMTCGGWFGFITQDERRAPVWARRAGMEWLFRLMQAPQRLFRRYATGALSTGSLAFAVGAQRSYLRLQRP